MNKAVFLLIGLFLALIVISKPTLAAGGGLAYQATPVASSKPVYTPAEAPIKELPRTGLPLAGSLIVGLAPLGWKLRKYGLKSSNPNTVWQDRELKK